jgi:hypothetical protein
MQLSVMERYVCTQQLANSPDLIHKLELKEELKTRNVFPKH